MARVVPLKNGTTRAADPAIGLCIINGQLPVLCVPNHGQKMVNYFVFQIIQFKQYTVWRDFWFLVLFIPAVRLNKIAYARLN